MLVASEPVGIHLESRYCSTAGNVVWRSDDGQSQARLRRSRGSGTISPSGSKASLLSSGRRAIPPAPTSSIAFVRLQDHGTVTESGANTDPDADIDTEGGDR